MKLGIDIMAELKQGRSRFLFWVVIAAIIDISFSQVTNVHAASDYDNVIQMRGSIGLYLPVNNEGMGRCSQPYLNDPKSDNLTNSWGGLLLDAANYSNSTVGADGTAFWRDLLNNPSNYAWSVSQYTNSYGYKTVQITASTTRGAQFEDIGGYKVLRSVGTDTRTYSIDYYSWGNPNVRCDVHVNYNNNFGKAIIAVDANVSVEKFVYINYDITYPQGQVYEGIVPSDTSGDSDNDGLTLAQESAMGTSDAQKDTDHDGLKDNMESAWNSNRENIFCDMSAAPHVCAYPDPLIKDIYVEIDWMKDAVSSKEYKPTSTQMGLVAGMYAAQGINFHADIGQYGGGHELPSYVQYLHRDSVGSVPDYADYKLGGDGVSSNFATNRFGIWHYIIYGNRYATEDGESGSSGWAEILGSDSFISGGVVDDDSRVTDGDRAVANTITHELGHNFCLSSERVYLEQPAECVFSGIDNHDTSSSFYNLSSYSSVMNYRYQLTDRDDLGVVKYSDGTNGSGDHDDWTAVKGGLGGFAGAHTLYIEFGASGKKHCPKSARGLVVAEERTDRASVVKKD